MGKRQNQRRAKAPTRSAQAVQSTAPASSVPAQIAPAHIAAHPPAKNPTLLAVSILLFALWFAFLLVTALSS